MKIFNKLKTGSLVTFSSTYDILEDCYGIVKQKNDFTVTIVWMKLPGPYYNKPTNIKYTLEDIEISKIKRNWNIY